jgi:hypothetical protein
MGNSFLGCFMGIEPFLGFKEQEVLYSDRRKEVLYRRKAEQNRACCKTRLVLHRLLRFFGLRPAKPHFLAVVVAKLKFCNNLNLLK